MTDVRTAWNDVSDRLEALALKLKLHAEQKLGEDESERSDADTWDRLRQAVDDFGDAVEDAAKDPAVRADLRDLVGALETAARATARQVSRTLDRTGTPPPAG